MNLQTVDLLSIAARSAAPLVAGALALVALRRASAAVRHVVALGSLAASIVAPAASLLVPGLALPVLPSRPVAGASAPVAEASTPIAEAPAVTGLLAEPVEAVAPERAAAEPSVASRARRSDARGASAPVAMASAPVETAPAEAAAAAAPTAAPNAAPTAAPNAAPTVRATSLAPVAFVLWIAAGLALLARLATGHRRASALARDSAAAPESFHQASREAARRLGLRSVPAVRLGAISTPVVIGLRRPVVILPEDAPAWTRERLDAVLLHELAHVGRGDLLARLVANAAVAVAPWNPLAWALRRAAEKDAERAADDVVLATGARASDYAHVLVSLVRERQAGTPRLALALGRPSDLSARVESLLDAATPRGLSAPARRLAAASLAVVAIAAATLTPVRVEAMPSPAPIVVGEPAAGVPGPLRMSEMLDAVPAIARPAGVRNRLSRPLVPLPVMVPGEGAKVVLVGGRGERSGSDWYDRGMDLHRSERYEEAIAAFAKSIGAGHREGASAYNIACGYALLGKPDEAFSWLKRAASYGFDVSSYLRSDDDLDSLRSDPRWASIRAELREAKSDADKAEGRRALAGWDRVRGDASASRERVENAAKRLYDAEEWTAAAAAYEEAARRGDRPGTMLYNAACSWALGGRPKEALDALERAVDQGWDDAAHMRKDDDLASLRGEARFRDIAKRAKSLELPPNWNSGLFSSLVHGSRKSGLREAAERYEAYLKERPQSPAAWEHLGLVRLRLDQWNEARAALEKCLALGHRKATTLYNLACVEAMAGNADRAFERLNASLDAGFDGRWTILNDEDLDSIRSDRRFREVLKRVRDAERDRDDD